jgi:hypothetical protein
MIYAFTQVQKARGGSWRLQGDGAGQVFLLSSGEDPIAAFVGKGEDREGRERRMPDIPAEVQGGSAFETIDRDALRERLPAFYNVMIKQCHGAPGRDWQRWLVELGAVKIKERIDKERPVFLALPHVQDIERRAQPQLRSIIHRFALYAASLHMAIEANVLPWTFEETNAGLIACLERWVAQRGNIDTAGEIVRAARQTEADLVAGLDDRFIRIHKTPKGWAPATEADVIKQKTPESFDGYVKPDRILVRPKAWRRYCNGFDPAEIARDFQQRNMLIADGNGSKLSKSERIMGRPDRFYNLKLPSQPQHSNTATLDC